MRNDNETIKIWRQEAGWLMLEEIQEYGKGYGYHVFLTPSAQIIRINYDESKSYGGRQVLVISSVIKLNKWEAKE